MTEIEERLFLRVVEAGSFKSAAEQIGVNASTISRRLARLEARLGVKLLKRSTRRSTPTDAGMRYFAGLQQLVEQQERLEAEVSSTAEIPRGRLRLTAPIDFGARFVAPILGPLLKEAPELEIELLLGSGFWDLSEQNIDVAIRIGRLEDSSLIARKLGMVPRVLVAAPSYLTRYGEPRTPEQLKEHTFVLYHRDHQRKPIELLGGTEKISIYVHSRIAANSISGICALVEAGVGLHLGPLWAFQDAIAAGRLTVLLPDYRLRAYPLYAVYASSLYLPAKIRIFVARLADHIQREGLLQEFPAAS